MATSFARGLLGWKPRKSGGLVSNCADVDSDSSVDLSAEMLRNLEIAEEIDPDTPANPGRPLEVAVAYVLRQKLPQLAPHREWVVPTKEVRITDYLQYEHLLEVDRLADEPALRVTLGRDYMIKPDVCVGLAVGLGTPFLQAAVSCKWTIRSDRVQNIRHENNQMIRHRRARLPHLVTVTAEPLPTRLSSIARGTGEVDAVYHIAFQELQAAVWSTANIEQRNAWDEAVGQGRLLDFDALPQTIAEW